MDSCFVLGEHILKLYTRFVEYWKECCEHGLLGHQVSLSKSDKCVCMPVLSRVPRFSIPWAVAHQASLSMGFSRQEFWNGLPFPTPGDRGTKSVSFASPALSDRFFTTVSPGKA